MCSGRGSGAVGPARHEPWRACGCSSCRQPGGGILRQLEVLLPVRLHREGLQPAVNGGHGDASVSSE